MNHTLSVLVPLSIFSFVFSASAQTWQSLGFGSAGQNGVPLLAATPAQINQSFQVTLTNGRPGARVLLALGERRSETPLFGATLVPSPDLVFSRVADSAGTARFTLQVPNNRELRRLLAYAQAFVVDPVATFGVAASNALEGTLCTWQSHEERFLTDQFLDAARSSGSWGGGQVQFSRIGGTGIHGDFDPSLGNEVGPSIFEWDLDLPGGFLIPQANTTTGQDEQVTDGRFFFQTLVVPAGIEVRFVGSSAARLSVSGDVRIDGKITVNGESIGAVGRPGWTGRNENRGEVGGRGGAMGGRGGAGGDRCNAVGRRPIYDGQAGEDVRLVSGHAYAMRFVGTGGQGSPVFPLDGQGNSVVFSFSSVISQHLNRGGGGGGFVQPGGVGSASWPGSPNVVYVAGGTTPGGTFGAFPGTFPGYTNGLTHADHFLVGGSGGGGSGSTAGGSVSSAPRATWFSIGRAGAGGAGALQLRLGGDLEVGAAGRIQAVGGSGSVDSSVFAVRGKMAPGGGGSGGSVLLQVEGQVRNVGALEAVGGAGGRTMGTQGDPVYGDSLSESGAGSNGIIHVETAQNPNGYPVGSATPAAPVSSLDPREDDPAVAVRSKWYPAQLGNTVTFLRYEIQALVDGVPTTFSDDPRFGVLASGAGSPVQFRVRGARLMRNAQSELVVRAGTTPTNWTSFVGPFANGGASLFGSQANGYRFELGVDRALGKTIVLQSVTLRWCL